MPYNHPAEPIVFNAYNDRKKVVFCTFTMPQTEFSTQVHESGKIMLLPQHVPYRTHLRALETGARQVQFVIFPATNDQMENLSVEYRWKNCLSFF